MNRQLDEVEGINLKKKSKYLSGCERLALKYIKSS
jgi:hypothetical protein